MADIRRTKKHSSQLHTYIVAPTDWFFVFSVHFIIVLAGFIFTRFTKLVSLFSFLFPRRAILFKISVFFENKRSFRSLRGIQGGESRPLILKFYIIFCQNSSSWNGGSNANCCLNQIVHYIEGPFKTSRSVHVEAPLKFNAHFVESVVKIDFVFHTILLHFWRFCPKRWLFFPMFMHTHQ